MMAGMRTMTATEFARGYAEHSGVTVEWLREHGREVRPCDCEFEGCEGWQMAHIEAARWAVEHGIATAEERAWLRE